jgi:hypothetical protein
MSPLLGVSTVSINNEIGTAAAGKWKKVAKFEKTKQMQGA